MCSRFITPIIGAKIVPNACWQNNWVWQVGICPSTWKDDQDLYRNRVKEETCS